MLKILISILLYGICCFFLHMMLLVPIAILGFIEAQNPFVSAENKGILGLLIITWLSFSFISTLMIIGRLVWWSYKNLTILDSTFWEILPNSMKYGLDFCVYNVHGIQHISHDPGEKEYKNRLKTFKWYSISFQVNCFWRRFRLTFIHSIFTTIAIYWIVINWLTFYS